MKRILLIAAFVLLHVVVNATNYYVSPWGDNSDGSTWAKAWTHPNSTNDGMNGNDTVFIAPGTYDSTYILPDDGNVYACSTLAAMDVLRSITRLRNTVALPTGTWVQRGSTNTWRWSVQVPAKWNAFQSQSATGWGILMRDGVMQNHLNMTNNAPANLPEDIADLDAALEYFYDQATDSLFVYSTTDPNGSSWRYGQSPVSLIGNGIDSVSFFGLTLEEGFQGIVLIGSSDITTDQPDYIRISHCNLWNTNHIIEAGNLGIIFASGYGTTWTLTQYGRFNTFDSDSFNYARSPSDDLSGGAGIDAYSQREMLVDSCWFGAGLKAGGIMLKNGGDQRTNLVYGNAITNCTFEASGSTTHKAHIWDAQQTDSLLITGNYFFDARYRAIDFHSTGSVAWSVGRIKVFNNTFVNCGGADAAPAVILTQRFYDSTGTMELKYNLFYDPTTTAPQVKFQNQSETGLQTPDLETQWDIDSNLYWTGSNAFVTAFMETCTGTDSIAWRACGFDVHGTFLLDPGITNVATRDFSRPSSTQEMNRTYGGRTYTRIGAWQPTESGSESTLKVKVKVR